MTLPAKPIYSAPVPLHPQLHRHKRLKAFDDFSLLSACHAVYIHATEFPHAACNFPIVFVPPSKGNPQVSPMVMLGLAVNDNLCVEGNRWTASYVPAYFRRLPYLTAPREGTDQVTVYIDEQWPGLSDTEGEPLFGENGEPAPALTGAIEFLKAFDDEARMTGQFCERLNALGLFTGMKADLSLPDGTAQSVDGFMVVDEPKLQALPESVVIELHRSGMLGLIHAHLMSLNNLRSLMDRQVRRAAALAA